MAFEPIDVSMVTAQGRFRDNRRGRLSIQSVGRDYAELVIDQPPQFGQAGTRTIVAMNGAKIGDIVGQLRGLADALEDVTDLEAWRQYEPQAPAGAGPYWWQHYPTTALEAGEATA